MTTFLPMMYAVSILCGYHHWEVDQISCRMNLVHCARAKTAEETKAEQQRLDAAQLTYSRCAAKTSETKKPSQVLTACSGIGYSTWTAFVTHAPEYFVADCAKELKIPGAEQ